MSKGRKLKAHHKSIVYFQYLLFTEGLNSCNEKQKGNPDESKINNDKEICCVFL